jgi:hypothetical protein
VTCGDLDGLTVSDRDHPQALLRSGTQHETTVRPRDCYGTVLGNNALAACSIVERVTGIELALSAWESVPSGPVTCPDLQYGVSASDRERPLVTGVNGPLMARRTAIRPALIAVPCSSPVFLDSCHPSGRGGVVRESDPGSRSRIRARHPRPGCGPCAPTVNASLALAAARPMIVRSHDLIRPGPPATPTAPSPQRP